MQQSLILHIQYAHVVKVVTYKEAIHKNKLSELTSLFYSHVQNGPMQSGRIPKHSYLKLLRYCNGRDNVNYVLYIVDNDYTLKHGESKLI